jgi:multidrug transporter EmrE-like cation transporter
MGGAMLGLALLCYAYTLKHLDLGVAYPIMTGGALTLISIASAVVLGEPLTLLKAFGAILVICGIAVLVNC